MTAAEGVPSTLWS